VVRVGQRPALGLQRRFLRAVVAQDVGGDRDRVARLGMAVGLGRCGWAAVSLALDPLVAVQLRRGPSR